jgi:phosphoribosylamine--glycine ligase
MPDSRDLAAILTSRTRDQDEAGELVLMEFIEGVEMGVGAYFNGTAFIRPACLDWEHKRFFAGDMGELTGEMGTVVTYQDTDAFFARTLGRMQGLLRQAGHVGYVNLNTIVNAEGIWPLEFTCRFGYPGFAILAPLQRTPWGELFRAMTSAPAERMATSPGYCVGVVVSTPPFPYSREQVDEPVGLPVVIDPELKPGCLHYGEMGLDPSGQLVTSGLYGWTLVVTGTGPTIAEAQRAAYARAGRILIPNVRYRLDIGDRMIAQDHRRLVTLGYLPPAPSPATEEIGPAR